MSFLFVVVPTILAEIAFTSSNPLEDHDTSITCQWQGSPDPEAIWLKDDVELVEEDLPSRIRITDTDKDGILMSELQIGDVELSDTGDYTCQVSNAVGTVMKITRLEVRGMMCVCVCVSLLICPPSSSPPLSFFLSPSLPLSTVSN